MSITNDFPTDIEARQIRQLHLIKNFRVNSIDKVGANKRTITHFYNLLQLLENYWSKFTIDDSLLAPYSEEEKEQAYFKDSCFFKGEAAYIDAKTDIKEEINRLLGVTTGDQLSGAGSYRSDQ